MDLGDPLPVGPALDRAVCERFLGWSNWRTRTNGCLIGKPPVGVSRVPLRVSTSDALAWEHVKEALRRMGFLVRVQEAPDPSRPSCIIRWATGAERPSPPDWWTTEAVHEFSDSTAEALCRVALRVVELRENSV